MATPPTDIATFVRDNIGAAHNLTPVEVSLWEGLAESMKRGLKPEHLVQLLALSAIAMEWCAAGESVETLLKHTNLILTLVQSPVLSRQKFRDLLDAAEKHGWVGPQNDLSGVEGVDPFSGEDVEDAFPEDTEICDRSCLPETMMCLYESATTKAAIVAKERNDASSLDFGEPIRQGKASAMLIGKEQILEVIDQADDKWDHIVKLSRDYDGPILAPKPGGTSYAPKNDLITWWSSLLARMAQLQEARSSREAVGHDIYQAGKATMADDISGRVKRRRRRAK